MSDVTIKKETAEKPIVVTDAVCLECEKSATLVAEKQRRIEELEKELIDYRDRLKTVHKEHSKLVMQLHKIDEEMGR
jgi:septal ring factor EnvC (AmiA/AmiB activator)